MKLLPCPFCGAEPEIDKLELSGKMYWNVACMNDNCLIHVETDDFGEGFIVFERQNDRGKDLTFSDRIKHFLLTEVAKEFLPIEKEVETPQLPMNFWMKFRQMPIE